MALDNEEQQQKSDSKLSLLQIAGSVLSAFFGVQSSKNKERDFNGGNHRVFIIAGLLFTALFLLGIFGVVQLVLSSR